MYLLQIELRLKIWLSVIQMLNNNYLRLETSFTPSGEIKDRDPGKVEPESPRIGAALKRIDLWKQFYSVNTKRIRRFFRKNSKLIEPWSFDVFVDFVFELSRVGSQVVFGGFEQIWDKV